MVIHPGQEVQGLPDAAGRRRPTDITRYMKNRMFSTLFETGGLQIPADSQWNHGDRAKKFASVEVVTGNAGFGAAEGIGVAGLVRFG
jgi:hypothetical protein